MYILKYTQKLNFKSIKVTVSRRSNIFFLVLPLGLGRWHWGTQTWLVPVAWGWWWWWRRWGASLQTERKEKCSQWDQFLWLDCIQIPSELFLIIPALTELSGVMHQNDNSWASNKYIRLCIPLNYLNKTERKCENMTILNSAARNTVPQALFKIGCKIRLVGGSLLENAKTHTLSWSDWRSILTLQR